VAVRDSAQTKNGVPNMGRYFDNPGGGQSVSGSLGPDQELDFDLKEEGLVRDIEIKVNPLTLNTLRDLRLRATWDEGAAHAVDVTLLSFIGEPQKLEPSRNAGASFDGKKLHLRWIMPYRKNARLSIFNSGDGTIQVEALRHVTFFEVWPRDWDYRFCAASGSARTQKGKPVQMLHVDGQGAFVGLALGIAPAENSARRAFAYLEGNETITADGTKYEGTGTEDFFNSAWYFPANDKPFFQTHHGMTFRSQMPPRVSAYRLMIPDAVPFKESFSFEFEHGRKNNFDDLEYRWVAFWYQKPPLKFEIADALNGTQSARQGGAFFDFSDEDPPPIKVVPVALGVLVCLLLFIAFLSRRSSSRN
ncbi:MAG TPA: DUF2961 domain-containing protein, partial [Abditibacteriaceae bacterium]|nr:DUF2961 domain-containing protein [Abditibacteriaceae bacterium]